jgi:hypothetical protein
MRRTAFREDAARGRPRRGPAGLADDEDRPSCAQQLLHRPLGFDHGCAGAQRGKRYAPRALAEAGLQRPRHRREQLLQPDWFLEEIEGADLGRLDGGFDRPMTRQHDDRHGELPSGRPFAQQRNAVGIGHPDVEQHQRRLAASAVAARLAGIFG